MRIRVPICCLIVGLLCPLSEVFGQGMAGQGGFGVGNNPRINAFQFQQKQTSPIVLFRKPAGEPPEWMRTASVKSQLDDEIASKLKQKFVANFPAVPLSQVMQKIADDQNIPVWINTSELDLLGVDANVPITLNLPSIDLRSALRLMLDPLDLTYIVRNSVLEITTNHSAESDPRIAYYDLSWVIDRSDQAIELVSAIQIHIDPECWLPNGGVSAISCVGQTMIVSASFSTQDKIREMLGKLASMRSGMAPKSSAKNSRAAAPSLPSPSLPPVKS
ncbi:MAG: hypothetical protein AB8B50_00295 [Pirellulaceae bacterium]